MDLIDAKYGGKDVKKFIIGYSYGGFLSFMLSTLRPNFFTSKALLAPYFGFLFRQKFERFDSVIDELNTTDP